MDKNEEYIAGTVKGKIYFFSLLGFGLLLYLVADHIIDHFFFKNKAIYSVNSILALEKNVQLLLAISIILLIISLPVMFFAIKLALRVKKYGCWPPPDTPMPFRTKIRRGKYAKFACVSLFLYVAVLCFQSSASFYIWYAIKTETHTMKKHYDKDYSFLIK